jgi:hypothetical protein
MLRTSSQTTVNKRWAERAEKDVLVDILADHIVKSGLKTPDLKRILPTISPSEVSNLRQGVAFSMSLERLETLAAGLGLIRDRIAA